ncbi:hypothetical protein EK21DRAFT_35794, partial [Setomelanomma holmii]
DENNIPGKSIPQRYAYRLRRNRFEKWLPAQSATRTTIRCRHSPAALSSAYLKRKQRTKLLIHLEIKSVLYGISRRMEEHKPTLDKEAPKMTECGEMPRSEVKADRRSRTMFGADGHATLERTHCLSVSRKTEE